jgi:hypothetical protein
VRIESKHNASTVFGADFFIKLCSDAEAYEKIRTPRPQSPEAEPPSQATDAYPEPVIFTVSLLPSFLFTKADTTDTDIAAS